MGSSQVLPPPDKLSASAEALAAEARHLLSDESIPQLSPADLDRKTIELAGLLLRLMTELADRSEQARNQKLARLMDDRKGQLFSTLLTDRVPRLRTGKDVVHQAIRVLEQCGIPRSLEAFERLQLRALKPLAPVLSPLLGTAIRHRIRSEADPFLIPGEVGKLSTAVERLRAPGTQVNVNKLGEEVLGHAEAQHHMDAYLELLATPAVDTISIKISSICAQLNVLAFDASIARISQALTKIYRAAIEHGEATPKLVMLDMEAYRDLELTHVAFTRVLDQSEFRQLRAGIVLQAYLPDSHAVQRRLIDWARARIQSGGAPIQMRLVKGANLAVERVESSQMGWTLPIYPNKTMVDASFKRMLGRALHPENVAAVRLGIASHNLFDIAHTLCLLEQRGVKEGVHFEVLAGMAGALSRALLSLGQSVLVYSPAVAQEHLHSAIAYLVRRLDENTADENFLRHSFGMKVGDAAWEGQRNIFLESRRLQRDLPTAPRRQARSLGTSRDEFSFQNEPDTDFTLRAERESLLPKLKRQHDAPAMTIPLYLAGQTIRRESAPGFDPSRPGHTPYFLTLASPAEVEAAISAGADAETTWSRVDVQTRAALLYQVADALRSQRAELIAAAVMDGGKNPTEADAEVSEAIDFATYYATTALRYHEMSTIALRPRGLTVITPPWNFPLAIPLGGAFAALAMGNPVILKPAQETALIATRAVEICYAAGIPQDALQLVVAEDEIATPLITDPRVQTVVLTGGTATARFFRELRPDLHLLAETGGKNATIISRFADLDLAIDSVVRSAFGHAGQKCSATSLLILPRELAEDPRFRTQLVDAAKSLYVGSAWNLESKITPLIHPPSGDLKRGLSALEPGESWWLQPEESPANPRIWSPGIKAGVTPGSYSHITEFFGPVLSVLIADDLPHAIEIANQTPYGLTAGFHSLDDEEIRYFCERMDAGNLYVNRTTTGAIVRRQPFGGRKASCFGPGAKAGGPNYVMLFAHVDDAQIPGDAATELTERVNRYLPWIQDSLTRATDLLTTAQGYEQVAQTHFRIEHDPTGVRGQDNHFRYQSRAPTLVIAFPGTDETALGRVLLACMTLGNDFKLAIHSEEIEALQLDRTLGSHHIESGDWQTALRSGRFTRVRALGNLPPDLHGIAAPHVAVVETSSALREGRVELTKYCLEQSVSVDFHRYGHLGLRELD